MDSNFWLNKWNKLEIGFHQNSYNSFLTEYWKELDPAPKKVLVPLCGASIDMLWLAEQGVEVVGVELSEKAVLKFFKDQQLDFTVSNTPEFKVYNSGKITLYCGDFFSFKDFSGVDALYDRASIIALPQALRLQYAKHIKDNFEGSNYFLITLEYDNFELGPPFSLSKSQIEELFGSRFKISNVKSTEVDAPEIFSDKISRLTYHLFLLK